MAGRFFLVAACIAGLVPAAFGQLSNIDKAFVTDAAQSMNFQIHASLLANQYSSNPEYRHYALDIANAQTENSGELQSTVAGQNTTMQIPSGVSPSGQRQLDALKNAKNVDDTFRSEMISSFSSTIRMYQHYIDQPDANEWLKKMAQGLLPQLEQQLEDARNLGLAPQQSKSR